MTRERRASGNTLVLVRHAHTEPVGPNAREWPLSARGRTEAAQLAGWSGWEEVTAIVASTEAKAIETAMIIAAPHPHLVALPPVAALGEVDRRGVFVPDYEAAVAAFFAEPDDSPCGWEAATAARTRFAAAVDAAMAAFAGQSVAVVAHGLILALFLSTLVGGPPADLAHWRAVPFASVARASYATEGSGILVQPFMGARSCQQEVWSPATSPMGGKSASTRSAASYGSVRKSRPRESRVSPFG